MGFVEDDEVVGSRPGIGQSRERGLPPKRIHRHDHEVAVRSRERSAPPHVRPGYDAEPETEQGAELPLPIAHEPGWGDDDYPSYPSTHEHLPDAQPGHDRLARTRIVREQKAKRIFAQHVVVDRDALVRQRIDPGDLAREGRVELIAVPEAEVFDEQGEALGISGEIQGVRVHEVWRVGLPGSLWGQLTARAISVLGIRLSPTRAAVEDRLECVTARTFHCMAADDGDQGVDHLHGSDGRHEGCVVPVWASSRANPRRRSV